MTMKRSSDSISSELDVGAASPPKKSVVSQELRGLEFFSGIGGLHFGLELALLDNKVSVAPRILKAFDINTIANGVYEASFGQKVSTRSIGALTTKDLDAFGDIDIWLLSPPCQPYTAGGKSLDDKDERAKPLLHLFDILPLIKVKPKFIFLENVPNFETSVSRNLLVACLQSVGYTYDEFIVSPMQFGIPNDRRRYYLAAKLDPGVALGATEQPDLTLNLKTHWPVDGSAAVPVPPLSQYMETLDDMTPFLLPKKYITSRPTFRFDIVRPDSTRSSTVTKSYGTKMVTRSGSFVQTRHMEVSEYNFEDNASIVELGLRFLTPVEVARLHAFPIDTEGAACSAYMHQLVFPESIPVSQKYKLLGNSLNVKPDPPNVNKQNGRKNGRFGSKHNSCQKGIQGLGDGILGVTQDGKWILLENEI
ncbi:S-adenosyl-L-methionine-dependent methyltransferase [Chytriomyces sp. MP71]|nr:S-adenosyl-L-methionine-dependent methyltransferase [Chytriomyces sp. MP71]